MEVHSRMQDAQELTLKRALLVYETAARSSDGVPQSALVTIHDVLGVSTAAGVRSDFAGGKSVAEKALPTIGAGELLDRAQLADVLRSAAGLQQRREVLPQRLLYCDPACMAWYAPSAVRPIWFNNRYPGLAPTMKDFAPWMNGREVIHPALLFVAKPGRGFYIFALAHDGHPSATDPVFAAPYYNLYDNGSMCLGNVKLPDTLRVGEIPLWERGFFDTHFTHANYRAQKLTTHPKGHDGLWRLIAFRQPFRGFPARYLAPILNGKAAVTAEEAINR